MGGIYRSPACNRILRRVRNRFVVVWKRNFSSAKIIRTFSFIECIPHFICCYKTAEERSE